MDFNEKHLDSYLGSLKSERNLSYHTIKNYNIDLKDFFLFLKDKQITDVTRNDARRFLYSLENRKFKRRSLARKISACRSFYSWLLREKTAKDNPFLLLSTPKLEKKLPNFLYKNEIDKLFSSIKGGTPFVLRDKALIELLYGSGIRVSEVIGLNLGDIDLASMEVRVLGKGGKERISLIGNQAVQALRNYLNIGRLRIATLDTRAVFLGNRGGRLTQRSVERLL
ncbi:hypothetical protein A2526_01490, partial [candidate division WOR-1 bacterium RIFOXYD2_FULL_36_8]